MNGLAALLALALAQESQAPPPAAARSEEAAPAPPEKATPAPVPSGPPAERPPPEPPGPRPVPPPEAASRPPAPEVPAAAPRKAPAAPATPAAPAPVRPAPAPSAIRAAPPIAPAGSPAIPTPTPPSTPTASGAGPPPAQAAPAPAARPALPDRAQVAAAAAKFFEALLARRAGDLAALSSPGFSFEGRPARGVEEVRARWLEAVARHDGVPYVLYDLEVLPAAEAVARFGKPPRRVAGLVQPGTWVAVANLSGRPTFVFFVRLGGAWLAAGLHD